MDKVAFIIHMVGMAMVIGSGFSILALKKGSSDMNKAEREPFMLRGFAVTNIGAMGIALVLISGLAMIAQSGGAFVEQGGTFFLAKLVLFLLYVVVFVSLRKRVKKARLTNGGPLMVNMSKFVVLMNVLGVMIIVAAVLSFH